MNGLSLALQESEPLIRLLAGTMMSFAFGINAYVAYKMWRYMIGWRRTAYVSYAVSVMLASGINAYIRLDWHLEGQDLQFADWQALIVAPIYLFTAFQGLRTIQKVVYRKPPSGSGGGNPQ